MVDQKARREYAQLVRQFVSGRMTNDEYENRFEAIENDRNDRAFGAVHFELWFCYDDIQTHKMNGRYRLDREGRRTVAQVVLFLQSNQDYPWPKQLWDGSVFLAAAFLVVLAFALFPETAMITRTGTASIVTLAWVGYERRRARKWEASGDKEAWPFLHQADLEAARRQPRLLNGKAGTMS